jgi:hypothetical protein
MDCSNNRKPWHHCMYLHILYLNIIYLHKPLYTVITRYIPWYTINLYIQAYTFVKIIYLYIQVYGPISHDIMPWNGIYHFRSWYHVAWYISLSTHDILVYTSMIILILGARIPDVMVIPSRSRWFEFNWVIYSPALTETWNWRRTTTYSSPAWVTVKAGLYWSLSKKRDYCSAKKRDYISRKTGTITRINGHRHRHGDTGPYLESYPPGQDLKNGT